MGVNRGPARTFRDLLVWQKAHGFVLDCYRFPSGFPKHETYGLVRWLFQGHSDF
jgi:23S rRNA-intervening sequence protein